MRHALSSLIFTFIIALSACRDHSPTRPTADATMRAAYHCAMHPQIISDKPGECPICHMALIRIVPTTTPVIKFYRNPMDPSVISPTPMKDGMGMDYIPVYEQARSSSPANPAPGAVVVPGSVAQAIGVTVAAAEYRILSTPIRAAAKVAYDPELYTATIEHQEAMSFLQRAQAQNSPELIAQAQSTVRASAMRLRQMGLSPDQISGAGEQDSALLLGSQRGSLWVYASIFDRDASLVRPGLTAELTSPALPGEKFIGKVQSIDTILNTDTRTLRVRIAVNNPRGLLKPEMYLSATIRAALGRRLAVPENAVLDTGTHQLVYVEINPGTYVPREVRAGPRADGYQEIISGLTAGERVATSANFLIDSESRIQAATAKAIADQ